MAISKLILSALRAKGIPFQTIHSRKLALRKKVSNAISSEVALDIVAAKEGIDVHKLLKKDKRNQELDDFKQALSTLNFQDDEPTLTKQERKTGTKIQLPRGIKTNFGMGFENAASNNAKIYPYLYVLENSLRKVILDNFKDKPDWWKNNKIVHPDIQNYAIVIKNAEKKYTWMPVRGDHPIYYVGLWELFKIIETNWKDFKSIFNNLEDLRTWMKEMVSIRHLVAHNVKTRQVDFENAKIRTTHICTMITKSYIKSPSKKSKK